MTSCRHRTNLENIQGQDTQLGNCGDSHVPRPWCRWGWGGGKLSPSLSQALLFLGDTALSGCRTSLKLCLRSEFSHHTRPLWLPSGERHRGRGHQRAPDVWPVLHRG